MAVAHDAHTEVTDLNSDPTNFTHTPVGTPRGVLIFSIARSTSGAITTERFNAITYGGVSMTRVPSSKAEDTGGEGRTVEAWFLGSSIPTGAQTVSVDLVNTTGSRAMYVVTVTAAADTQIVGTPVLLQEDGTLAEQNVDTSGTTALRYACLASGLGTTPSPGANSTAIDDHDYTNDIIALVRETTGGSGSRPVGFSSVTSDDRAAVHIAVAEVGGGGGGGTARSFAVVIA